MIGKYALSQFWQLHLKENKIVKHAKKIPKILKTIQGLF